MKRTVVVALLLVFVAATWSSADYHIVQAVSVRSKDKNADKMMTAMIQTVLQKLLPEVHYWLSNERSAAIVKTPSPGGSETILVDLAKGTCTLTSGLTKRYVTTALPFDRAAVLSEAALRQLPTVRVSMLASTNELRRKIKGFPCTGYTLTSDGADDWAAQRTIWATEGLRLDLERLQTALAIIGQATVGGLLASRQHPEIKGFPLLSEVETTSLTLTIESVKIEEAPIPEALFAIPGDYARVDRFEIGDLIGENDKVMRQMLSAK